MSSPLESEVLIVGAGPAGLATAASLKQRGIRSILLERESQLAASWRRHYDRLHLHTARRFSSLPHFPMPKSYPTYPSRQQVVDYLEDYAAHFDLKPLFGREVTQAARSGTNWELEVATGECFRAPNLVIASGYNGRPRLPEVEGLSDFPGLQVHSSEYRNGSALTGKQVLVVGCGNSGAEIAVDLVEHGARPSLVVRNKTHVVPRDLLGRPSQASSILLSHLPTWLADAISRPLLALAIGDLSEFGILRPEMGPRAQIEQLGRVPILDVGTVAHIKAGRIKVVPGLRRFEGSVAEFEDRSRAPFDAVVLATGYRTSFDEFLAGAGQVMNERGQPRVFGEEAAPGLYFVGFRNPPTGALREMNLESRRIARTLEDAHRSPGPQKWMLEAPKEPSTQQSS